VEHHHPGDERHLGPAARDGHDGVGQVIAARAAEVFDDLDLALAWLKTPVAALEDATPLSLVDTDIGTDSVMDTLGRIEHGVFA